MNLQRVTKVSVLAVAFIWASYSISSHAMALSTGVKAASLSSTSQTVSATTIDTQNGDDHYAGLPKAVANSVQSVVAVQRITSNTAKNNAVVASGVILNNHQVLTAGHATTNTNGNIVCTNTSVNTQGYATSAAASAVAVTSASALHSENADLAVLGVADDQNYQNLPKVTIATVLPKTGDIVYFINYQPQSDGTIRDPLAKDSTAAPVIFSATVVSRDSQGLVIAAGGGTSYGHGQSETLLRKGASGGAIVNGNGELVGLSVSSDSLDANRNSAYIGTNYNVSLPEGLYQIVNGQMLSMQLLTRLQTNMSFCK